jgi:hypothetical protein
MTPAEAASLLSLAAAYDNRKPDADAAQAWALALDGCRYEDCREVVVDHYRRSNEWLMPNMVISGVKRLRDRRLSAVPDPTPPAHLTPLEANRWLGERRREIADGKVPEPPVELPGRDMTDVTARVVDEMPQMPRVTTTERPAAEAVGESEK